MNIRSSLKVMLLALAVSQIAADGCDTFCDKIFDVNNWFITPKIGVAPSIFAGRARQQLVVPRAAILTDDAGDFIECPTSSVAGACLSEEGLLDNFANTLQETPCLPKFSNMFRQGVLHVGVELGYQACDESCPVFVEFVYNRASGRCLSPCTPYYTNKATSGCSNDCNTSCSSSSSSCGSSCTTSSPSLSNICSLQDNYSNYSAYGAYIGGRHFTDRFWCDAVSFWFGYKVGILHRKQVNSCSTLVITNDCTATGGQCSSTQDISLNRAIFCKSNAVSGGVQVGFDYNYNDCLSFQLGFEVVASSGLKGNRNLPINIGSFVNTLGNPILECSSLPSNIMVLNSGTLVNFPIWFGVRWEFGSCCSSC